MRRKVISFLTITVLVCSGTSALLKPGESLAQSSELEVLNELAKGEWTIRFRDGSPSRKICVRSGQEMLQLQHGRTGCRQVVLTDSKQEAAVQYSCKGDGYGRTIVRRETGELVQLSGQGFADGRPFEFFAEARRTGSCS